MRRAREKGATRGTFLLDEETTANLRSSEVELLAQESSKATEVAEDPSEAQEDPKEGQDEPSWTNLERFLGRIPPVEADMLTLYKDGLSQIQIASIFGCTQAAVSYRIRRAKKRIQWLSTVPELDPSRFHDDLSIVLSRRQITVLKSLYETGSQTRAAEALFGRHYKNAVDWKHGHLNQGTIRSVLRTALNVLRTAVRSGHPASVPIRPYLAWFTDFLDNARWTLASESRMADRFPHMRRAEIVSVETTSKSPRSRRK